MTTSDYPVRQQDANGVYWRCRGCGELRGNPHAHGCEVVHEPESGSDDLGGFSTGR